MDEKTFKRKSKAISAAAGEAASTISAKKFDTNTGSFDADARVIWTYDMAMPSSKSSIDEDILKLDSAAILLSEKSTDEVEGIASSGF